MKRSSKRTKKATTHGKKRKHSSDIDGIKIGRWEKWEHETFLQGLKTHGNGKWKLIAKMIPTRYDLLCFCTHNPSLSVLNTRSMHHCQNHCTGQNACPNVYENHEGQENVLIYIMQFERC